MRGLSGEALRLATGNAQQFPSPRLDEPIKVSSRPPWLHGLAADHVPHYDLITEPGQVQIYEAVMGDAALQLHVSL
jgi:hypothetical protein